MWGTRLTVRTLGTQARKLEAGEVLAAITLAGGDRMRPRFGNFSSSVGPVSAWMGGPATRQGDAPMSTIAAVAQTSDQIDYWIGRRVIQPCHQTHLSRSKPSPARDRSFWLSAIGQCLRISTTLSRVPSPRISLRSSSNSKRRNSIDPQRCGPDTCVRTSLNAKNREARFYRSGLARLRSGISRGACDWNRNDRTARKII